MIKKVLKKVFIGSALIGSVALADSSAFEVDSYSLLGFEGGYSSLNVEKNVPSTPAVTNNYKLMNGGLKIGAQSDDYRLFLSARFYNADEFDYVTTLGGELQYLFNLSSIMNFYIGVNGGLVNISFTPVGETSSRTISNPYFGGDAGFNLHLGKMTDLEFGARIIGMDAQNIKSNATYKFNSIVTGYASIIFKWKMD